MRIETSTRICKAAEDWIQGYDIKALALKYDRSEWTIYQWKNTDVWKQIVAGCHRKTRVPYDKDRDPSLIVLAGHLWVAHGKPSPDTFAEKFGVPEDKLEDWMASSYWGRVVRDAEEQAERRTHRNPPRKQAKHKFPYHQLERAIYLYFAGWTTQAIGKAVGKSPWTIRDWQKTDAWQKVQDGVLFDKLKTHVLEKRSAPKRRYPKKTKKHLIRRHTRVRIYEAAERWLLGYTIKEIAEKHNCTERTIYDWKKTEIWKQTVAGRQRQKHRAFWQENLFSGMYADLLSLDVAAYRWVERGKPAPEVFSQQYIVSKERLETWMASRFWNISVRCAEQGIQSDKDSRHKPQKKIGSRFPYHLLKQAVVLNLTGWTSTEIGKVINRSPLTVTDWQQTTAWQKTEEEIQTDTLLWYIVDFGLHINEMYHNICESQGLSYQLQLAMKANSH